MSTADPAKSHDRWLKIGSWRDSTDATTGYKRSGIGEPADFHGAISEQHATGTPWNSGAKECEWHVTRQRTEREGPDKDGLHWTGWLAEGTARTMALAKSAATKSIRQLRTDHILSGGDVGYGNAPTGEQIRDSIARRRALEPGQSMVMESGELDGVQWERRLCCPRGTIGAIESFRLLYRGEQSDTLPKGRTPAAVADKFRQHVDERPARMAAAEQQHQSAVAESIATDQARYHWYKALNVLDYSQVCDAWKAAHDGRPASQSLIARWAQHGVTEAENTSEWYQAGIATVRGRQDTAAQRSSDASSTQELAAVPDAEAEA